MASSPLLTEPTDPQLRILLVQLLQGQAGIRQEVTGIGREVAGIKKEVTGIGREVSLLQRQQTLVSGFVCYQEHVVLS